MHSIDRKKRKKGDFKFEDSHVKFFEKGVAELETDEMPLIYLENDFSKDAKDFSSLKTFFVARTGLGKSAILEKVKLSSDKKYIVQIDPESFMPKLLENAASLEALERSGINIDYFLKTLWRFVIVVELLKRKYGAERKGMFEKLKMSSETQKAAYAFLEKFKVLGPENSLSERVVGFLDSLNIKLKATFDVAGIKFTLGVDKAGEAEITLIKQVLRDFEFPEVNNLVKELDSFLDGDSYYLLIDELDKAWIRSGISATFIKSLFLAMVDIANLKNVKAIISLRTNLFNQLKFSQPEKLRPFIAKIAWSDNDLKNMIDLRFKFLFDLDTNYVWQNIFPSDIRFSESIRIHQYLMMMSNRKPRDLFYLISLAIGKCLGKNRLTQESFKKIEVEYSEDRLRNFIAEWESPYTGLADLLCYFQGAQSRLTGEELRKIIDSMIVAIMDSLKRSEEVFNWTKLEKLVSDKDENFDDPQGIFAFLYRIGVIGFKDDSKKIRYNFDYDNIPLTYKLIDSTQIFINPALAYALTKSVTAYSTVTDFSPD